MSVTVFNATDCVMNLGKRVYECVYTKSNDINELIGVFVALTLPDSRQTRSKYNGWLENCPLYTIVAGYAGCAEG